MILKLMKHGALVRSLTVASRFARSLTVASRFLVASRFVRSLTVASRLLAASRLLVVAVLAAGAITGCGAMSVPIDQATEVEPLIRIMPVGDSITQGSPDQDSGRYGPGTHGAYRSYLWDLILADGFEVDFVGGTSDGPEGIDADHEGHPAWEINRIAVEIDAWMATHEPDAVLLMIGTNDVFFKTVEQALEQLESLLGSITAGLPEGGYLLVASIPPLTGGHADRSAWVTQYNTGIISLVDDLASEGDNVVYVEVFDLFDESDIGGDGVHPNESGFRLIAEAWYSQLATIRSTF